MTKEMFAPEKCPKCGETTDVEHYDTGWRCVCGCGWYGVFHFDEPEITPLNRQAMFRDDGSITSVPTAISEAPPYVQGELFRYLQATGQLCDDIAIDDHEVLLQGD